MGIMVAQVHGYVTLLRLFVQRYIKQQQMFALLLKEMDGGGLAINYSKISFMNYFEMYSHMFISNIQIVRKRILICIPYER